MNSTTTNILDYKDKLPPNNTAYFKMISTRC